jgi:hypothetical protein
MKLLSSLTSKYKAKYEELMHFKIISIGKKGPGKSERLLLQNTHE